jgi:hypothetical protein
VTVLHGYYVYISMVYKAGPRGRAQKAECFAAFYATPEWIAFLTDIQHIDIAIISFGLAGGSMQQSRVRRRLSGVPGNPRAKAAAWQTGR